MCFAEYATRIFALLPEDGMGNGKTSVCLPPYVTLCCHCCPSQKQRKRLIQTGGVTLARTQ